MKRSRPSKQSEIVINDFIKEALQTESLDGYIDCLYINPTLLIDSMDDISPQVALSPGNNEGYYIEVNHLENGTSKAVCCIRTHGDEDTALEMHKAVFKHFGR